MKNKIKLLGFVGLLSLAACEKTYVEPSVPAKTEERSAGSDAEQAGKKFPISRGEWRVYSFQWHDRQSNVYLKESNDHFKDYIFMFGTDGIITAIHRSIKEQGKWAIQNTTMMINFGNLKPLNEMNNNKWVIKNHTANYFELKGISPYDNSTEFLVFERIAY